MQTMSTIRRDMRIHYIRTPHRYKWTIHKYLHTENIECVCVCVRACVRACVCVCVCARARARAQLNFSKCRGIRIWNQQVQTDSTIANNKPDIIIRDNGKRIRMLIDAAISRDINVIWKQAKKILKHKRRRNTARVECENKSDSHQE